MMKVLVATDDPISQAILEESLAHWGYEVRAARDGEQAWSLLDADEGPRLAILDASLSGRDGAPLWHALRDRRDPAAVYVLLLMPRDRREDILAAVEGGGADDCIPKPVDLQELKVHLRSGERVVALQEELTQAREQLQHRATHDALTGVLNRGAALEALERELARARRHGGGVGLLLVDIDYFKVLNDAHGHAAGDAVLREAARRIGTLLRPYDGLGRYGGEEFVVVLTGTNMDQAAEVAERLRRHVADHDFETASGPLRVSVSIGVAAASGSVSPEALIRAADEALCRAKAVGRDRVETAVSLG
jgi:diguanylate cyclase (GGDEF)-like protein